MTEAANAIAFCARALGFAYLDFSTNLPGPMANSIVDWTNAHMPALLARQG